MERRIRNIFWRVGVQITVFFAASFAAAQVPTPTVVAPPKVAVDASSFDWGTISHGAKVSHDFTLKNIGGAELIIQRMVPSCGCTATNASTNSVPPGATATIHVDVDSSGFAGSQSKSVRLFTNDPEQPFSVLTLKGSVEQEINIEPARLVFPEVVRTADLKPPTAEFTVKVREGSPVTITKVSSYSKFLTVEESQASDKQRHVKVTLDPKVPNGELRDRIVIGLSGSSLTSVNVPVIATVKGPIKLKPNSLSFGIIEGTEVITKHVQLESSAQQPLKIEGVSSSDASVTASFSVVKPGKIFDIQVNVDPRKVSKDLRSAVTIETDSKDDESVTLSIYGILPPKE